MFQMLTCDHSDPVYQDEGRKDTSSQFQFLDKILRDVEFRFDRFEVRISARNEQGETQQCMLELVIVTKEV
jgi:hypothetical protein